MLATNKTHIDDVAFRVFQHSQTTTATSKYTKKLKIITTQQTFQSNFYLKALQAIK